MTATLAQSIAVTDVDPSAEEFFSYAEAGEIGMIRRRRECSEIGSFPPSCSVNLAFGFFFFDGTNNNLERNYPKHSHSKALRKLHAKLSVFLPVGEGKQKNKGVVEHIYYSIFGFSRGAAEARVFANWLFWLCKLDAELTKQPGVTLGSIPVTFDFMGLFDTVASVGLASSAPLLGAHGHYGWADADHSLKLPKIVPGQVNLSLHNQIE